MNKFHDMMAYLAAHDADFSQVVALDVKFDLFTRAWCVSELATASAMGMRQHLKPLNSQALKAHTHLLRSVRVENMKATRPEDIEEILLVFPTKHYSTSNCRVSFLTT